MCLLANMPYVKMYIFIYVLYCTFWECARNVRLATVCISPDTCLNETEVQVLQVL